MRLLSWIGHGDYLAWKNDRGRGDGALVTVALSVQPTRLDLLWDDSGKIPLADAPEYVAWLKQQLAKAGLLAEIVLHPCMGARVMDFAWIYRQLEQLVEQVDLEHGEVSVNASSGTWAMSACWIVFKKATGLNWKLFQSSPEKGTEEVQLPPNLSIDMTEAVQGKLSPLIEKYLRGELSINLPEFKNWVANSTRMREILVQASLIARFSNIPVLLLGPPGSGKSSIARLIHDWSGCEEKSWVTVDCGTLTDARTIAELWGWEKGAFTGAEQRYDGRLAAGDKGTIFFDEIGNAEPLTQRNLLRVLQEKKYRPAGSNTDKSIETRVIAATNSNLDREVRDGKFRQDLRDRLSGFAIKFPWLRDCREDIVPLAQIKLRKFNQSWGHQIEQSGGVLKQFSREAERELQRYSWPGNIRELENLVQRLAILTIGRGEEIGADDVRRELSSSQQCNSDDPLSDALGECFDLERELNKVRYRYVAEAWKNCQGNKSEMARLLGFKNRTPLRTLLGNLKEVGYELVDDM